MDYRLRLELITRVQALLGDYVYCLDNDRFEDWPNFFAEKCIYRVTSAENVRRSLPVSLIYCDSRAMLIDRVKALREANIYEEHTYRHLLGPTTIQAELDAGRIEAHTGFVVIRTTRGGEMTTFASGQYVDMLVLRSPSEPPLIQQKIVVCDSSQIDTLLVLPL